MPILTIARLTLHEAARRRVVLVGVLITLVLIGLTAWGFSQLPTMQCGRVPCSQAQIRLFTATFLILIMYMFSFIIAVGASFLAAPAVATDIESGIALAMLPRPIRRSDIILGKWLGLAVIITVYTALVAAAEFALVKVFVDYLPPEPVIATAFITVQGLTLMTLGLLGSTRLGPMAGGIIAIVMFGLAWMGGIVNTVGQIIENITVVNVATIISLILPTDGLWRGAVYHLEPQVLIAALSSGPRGVTANPFFVDAPPTPAFLVWSALWLVAVLGLAMYSFGKREL